MEELKELVRFVNKNKIKNIQILGGGQEENANWQVFYEGITEGKFENEASAAEYFFGGLTHKDVYFNRLKRNLFNRLTNTMFFIDVNQPSFNDLQKAYINCYKGFAAMRILIGRGIRKPAISIGERLLRQAVKYEFTNLVVDIARELRNHYGSIHGNRKKFAEYNKILKSHLKTLNAEILAEEYYSDLVANFVTSAATPEGITEIAREYAEELREHTKTLQSYRLNLLTFNVSALYFQIINDYQNTLKICVEAIEFFENKKAFASNSAVFTFRFKMLSCYIQLKNYEEGEITAKKCLEFISEGQTNWFLTLYNYLILCYHSKKLQQAFEYYNIAIEHPNFKNLHQQYREEWRIHEAFIHYFILIGKIEVPADKTFKKFRISKFLNEVPIYSKDKRGSNITILIIQILFLLQQKKYNVVIDRMEALNVYCHRYLRKDDTFRSNCFIKMLMILPSAYFNKIAAIRKSKKFTDKLKEVPLEMANQSSELEIVPYELLWEYVLESLK